AGPYSFTVSDANGCSVIVSGTVTQPQALSASCSSNNNSIYFGYSGDQTAIVTVNPSGGVGPYTVSLTMNRPLLCNQITSSGDETWFPGAKTASSNAHVVCPGSGGPSSNPSSTSLNTIVCGVGYSATVSLMSDAIITALVTDSNGCTTTCSISLHAEDVRCFAGNSGIAKVQLCHKTGSAKNPCVGICVDNSAVAEHLAHGDFFGKCTPDCSPANSNSKEEGLFDVLAYPNPSNSQFTLEITNGTEEFMNVEVFDMAGRLIKHIDNISNGKVTFGEELPRGVYLAVVNQGANSKTLRIVKED
ncbi:T9SS type A sorting domain-containing protein, partial [Flavobacterium sp. SM15]|uniref:T9SS type A sorting domain-containing protein n=1 Tax=Flavobacterium sp. SM15 TaxID=2908005 RepID=UPI001EDB73DD